MERLPFCGLPRESQDLRQASLAGVGIPTFLDGNFELLNWKLSRGHTHISN
jgi:hypothetical protein